MVTRVSSSSLDRSETPSARTPFAGEPTQHKAKKKKKKKMMMMIKNMDEGDGGCS
jgi:hypothetical protein